MLFKRKVYIRYLGILFALLHISILNAQDNTVSSDTIVSDGITPENQEDETASFPQIIPENQDSLLIQKTNLHKVWEDTEGSYIEDHSNYNIPRFEQTDLRKRPKYFIEIIRDTLLYNPLEYNLTFQDTIIIDPIFMPVIFTGKVLPNTILPPMKNRPDSLFNYDKYASPYKHIMDTTQLFAKEHFEENLRQQAYRHFTYEYPEFVRYTLNSLPGKVEIEEPIKVNIFKDLFAVENNPDFKSVGSPDKFTPKRKYWIIHGNSLLQFSQNYISDNWYKGGTGNLNIVSAQTLSVDYKKDLIEFNNLVEWKLSLYTNPNDSLRQTKIGTDLVRTYSNFGLQAFNDKFFYSTNLEIKTQLFNNYKENTNVKVASLMSPLLVNMGILGMRYSLDKSYKKNKSKKLKVNVDISPLSVKYNYVGDKDVDPTRYEIPAGKKHLTVFGSTINSTFGFKFNQAISLSSRFKYFTNYHKMEVESENELNMSINRYFSTRIYLYLRFDDGEKIPRDPKLGYLQVNELLSFGFNYKW